MSPLGRWRPLENSTISRAAIGGKADVTKKITGFVAIQIKILLRISQQLTCVGAM